MNDNSQYRELVPFSKSKTFLIGYDVSQPKIEIEELRQFGNELRGSGKEVNFLMYHNIKKLEPSVQNSLFYQNFSRKDLGLFGKASSSQLKDYINRDFDFFINGSFTEHKFLAMFAKATKSKFRIGKYFSKYMNYYDLMIQPNGVDECENFLVEIGKNLKILR